jgi:hypothetical protein
MRGKIRGETKRVGVRGAVLWRVIHAVFDGINWIASQTLSVPSKSSMMSLRRRESNQLASKRKYFVYNSSGYSLMVVDLLLRNDFSCFRYSMSSKLQFGLGPLR